MQRRTRHRWGRAVVLTAAFAMAAGAQGAAVAVPAKPPAADREFASSFEAGDPAPDWLSTVDTGPDGTPRASGVDGGYSTGIPGNVNDHVTEVRASGENAGAGEVKENLADGESGTKWLTFQPTGWAEFDLDKPVEVRTYALTSANDAAARGGRRGGPPGAGGAPPTPPGRAPPHGRRAPSVPSSPLHGRISSPRRCRQRCHRRYTGTK